MHSLGYHWDIYCTASELTGEQFPGRLFRPRLHIGFGKDFDSQSVISDGNLPSGLQRKGLLLNVIDILFMSSLTVETLRVETSACAVTNKQHAANQLPMTLASQRG